MDKLNGNVVDVAEHIVDKEMKEAIKTVDDVQKREYMERVWGMSKDQIFHELMRVHAESAKLISQILADAEARKDVH